VNLNRLILFKSVATLGSFTKAAQSLQQPKSRISRNIAALEKELGVALIYRTTRQFQLTTAGKELYQKVGPHLAALEGVIQNVDHQEKSVSGQIRMTVPNDVGIELMANYCFEFQQRYPLCQIDLLVDNKNVDLVGESVDLALRFGSLRDSTLKLKKLGTVQLRLFAGANWLRLTGPLTKINDLENLNYISFRRFENKKRTIRLTHPKGDIHLKVSSIFSSDNFFVNKKMMLLGGGFGFLPTFIAQKEVLSGELVSLFKEWATEKVAVSILMPQQKSTPLRIKVFLDFLELKLKEVL